MHRSRGRYGLGECKDPATVLCIDTVEVTPAHADLVGRLIPARTRNVTYGAPLLKRTIGGVWSVDPLAPWGTKGPSLTPQEASTIWARAQEELGRNRWAYGRGHNREHAHIA